MVDVGIISSLTKLPLGVLQVKLDQSGPFTGNNIRDTWTDAVLGVRPVSDTYGVVVQANGAVAPELGYTFGIDDGAQLVLDKYRDRICQVATIHQLLSGVYVASQIEEVFIVPQLLRWAEDLPGRIGLYVAPTWAIDLYFLVTI